MNRDRTNSQSGWADPKSLPLLLDKAREFSDEYINNLAQRPVFPTESSLRALSAFDEPLPETSTDPFTVLEMLHQIGAPATVPYNRGRYFGFVNGGMLPVSLAAKWIGDVWDQNAAFYAMSPISSHLEELCERWIVSLLGLPENTAAGFVSGTTIANLGRLVYLEFKKKF